ncbi:MAG TPA: four-carbon acid sugar kinase family protein [Firmicutes bacterium]|jgi:uncharacterized protein YgbK (DUF1537 family)|nr:four-carbon acid sugar kinase family protein [Bacillota bacterium]
MKSWLVIADDLTGANDTAAQFASEGIPTVVLVHQENLGQALRPGVTVINSETRGMTPQAAYARVASIARQIPWEQVSLIYKKIDSTLRGNIGAEIDALMDHIGVQFSLICPAYPGYGRTTLGGYHLVDNQLLADSPLAEFASFQVKDSSLPALLTKQSRRQVAHANIAEIRSGSLTSSLLSLLRQGSELITTDCVSRSDLETIVWQVKSLAKPVLWVGSAGLASVLVSDFQQTLHKPTLVVAGSYQPVTTRQVQVLAESGTAQLYIPPSTLVDRDFIENCEAYLTQARRHLAKGDLVITVTQGDNAARSRGQEQMPDQAAVAKNLSLLIRQLVQEVELSGLVLAGGTIAYQVCSEIGITALEIVDQVEEGIPVARAVEGNVPLIVTKAGGFGKEDALLESVRRIKQLSKRLGLVLERE